jgi:AraC-like DNA-binding protein
MQENSVKPDPDTDPSPSRFDRLSSLMARFPIRVTPAVAGSGNFGVFAGRDGGHGLAALAPTGAPGAAARLCEVLVIRMLRAGISRGAAGPGLLSGLTHPRVSRALAAIHDDPGRPWRNADLAGIAGLSLSRFAQLFGETVRLAPGAHLRRWRLTLARQEPASGARVKSVARRLGYASPEALARAVQAEFGASQTALRAA